MVASFIRPNRTEVNRTFPWLGFTIRTATAPAWFEVAIATNPSLFDADAKSRRTPETFYSTRAAGPLPAPSGEAVWIVPPAVLARFAGQPQIYYALATFRSADRQGPEIVRVPAAAASGVVLSKSFTGVTRRLAGVGGRGGDAAPDYGAAAASASLEWAGDTVLTTAIQPAAPAAAPGAAAPAATASALDFTYSDGFGALPEETVHRHRYPAQALGGPYDIYWDEVELVPQPNGWSCWAAAAAMVVGWRDRVSIDPSTFGQLPGYQNAWQHGLNTDDNAAFAAAWGLDVVPPLDPTVDYFAQLLQSYGPLWIGRHPSLNPVNVGHAVCVVGLHGDGTPDGTYVHWHDPSPPGRGTANRMETYTAFLQEFDDFMTVNHSTGAVNNQILHSSGIGGRTPGRVPASAAAQALGDAIDLVWNDVELVPQMTSISCWAAAGAMVVGWRDRVSIDPSEIARGSGHWAQYVEPPAGSDAGGLSTDDNAQFARAWRLEVEPPQDYTVDGFRRLLETKGPLWVGRHPRGNDPGQGHAVCVIGLSGDGTPEGTHVHWNDPEPETRGTTNMADTYRAFMTEFDDFMTADARGNVNCQIMHSGGTGGRTPGTFAARAAAQSVAMEGGGGGAAAGAVGEIAGVAIEQYMQNVGDLQLPHVEWDGMWYPPGVQRGNTPTTQTQVTVAGPRYKSYWVDEIYSDLDVTFEYDGRGVGKVAIQPGRHSDAVGMGLVVYAHIAPEARIFTAPGVTQNFGGLRITIDYTWTQARDDVVGRATLYLYGNGDYDLSYSTVQGEIDTIPDGHHSPATAVATPARPQALDATSDVARSIGSFIIDTFDPRESGISAALDRWPRTDQRGPTAQKYPFDDPNEAGDGGMRRANVTVTSPHTSSGNYCDLAVSWDYNGRALTNVDITSGDAHGVNFLERLDFTYSVSARILDVAGAFQDAENNAPCAGLRILIEWREHRPVKDDTLVLGTLTIFGNGGYMLSYDYKSGDVENWTVIGSDHFHPSMRPVGRASAAAHALDAASDVVRSIGSFIIDTFDPRESGINATLDRWPRSDQRGPTAQKYPFDDPNESGSGGTQRASMTVTSPRSTSGNYCDLAVSWDYNGRALTNVDITTGDAHGVNFLERLDFTYTVTARIVDVAGAFQDGQNNPPCAGLRILCEWREQRPVKDNTVVLGTLTIFGNGGYMLSYDYKSGDIDNLAFILSDHYHPSMRPIGRQAPAAAHALEAAPAAPAAPPSVTRSSETRGTVRFDLDQLAGVRQPPGQRNGAGPMQTATVAVAGPRASTVSGVDETYGDCEVTFEYDGHSVGNIHVRPTAAGGAAPLQVLESIAADDQAYVMPGGTDQFVAVPLDFSYYFASAPPAATSVVLYGNGTHDVHYRWSRG